MKLRRASARFPFAWFQVAATGTASGNAAATLATVEAKPTVSGIAFDLSVAITELGSSNTVASGSKTDDMEMMTVLDLDDNPSDQVHDYQIRFGYYVKGSSQVRYSENQFTKDSGKKDYWKYYSVAVSIPASDEASDGITYTQEEIFNAIKDFAIDVNVTADAAHDTVAASRAKFYVGADATPAAPTAPGANVELADNVKFTSASQTLTYYFGMYVDGEGQDFDANGVATTPNGNFTVTIGAHS